MGFTKRRELVERAYEKRIGEVDLDERQRRDDAIKRFQRFVQKYQNDATYTPDAMFRLAELYFERSQVDYSDAIDQYDRDRALYDRGKIPAEPREPQKDYADTVRVYRELLDKFGSKYRYADAVQYLLGFVLSESGRDRAARVAWLTLVNKHPKSEYVAEVWLRMGESYFDTGDFEKAASAYKNALAQKGSNFYDKALYKMAWTYFQLYDYDSAIKTFKQLIAHYSGKGASDTGGALRDEAIDYLAKSLAEDDWDNDGLPDDNAGVARAMGYLNTGEAYEQDIIEQYAKALYDLHDRKKYRESVSVYEGLVKRAPLAAKAVDHQRQIINIYDILRDIERATAERQRLADMVAAGSPWWEANKDNARARASALTRAEVAMRERALWFHQRAQELKAQAAIDGDPEMERSSLVHYGKAAAAYADYLERYPNEPAAYELAWNRAEALWYSGQFAKAAPAYMAVATHRKKERRADAAWSAVKAYEQLLVDAKGRVGDKALPNSDWEPKPQVAKPGELTPVMAEEMPRELASWLEAADYFVDNDLTRADGGRAQQSVLAYQAAEMYFRYKRYPEARQRFAKILACYPKEEVAGNAIANLLNSYREENDYANLEKWANMAEKLQLGSPEQVIAMRKAIKIFKLGAQFENAERLLAEKNYLPAAREFEKLASENPTAEFADKAFYNAAMAYKEVRYYDSAVRIFEKLVTEPQYAKSSFAEDSLFELAENYKLFFYFDKAIGAYMSLFTRYPKGENRAYALIQAAALHEATGDLAQAASTYERYAEVFSTRKESPNAFFKAGELYERLGNDPEQDRIWRQFVDRYRQSMGMGGRVLEAKLRMSRLAKKGGNDRQARKLWDEVLRDYEVGGFAPGSEAALAAAEARFELVEIGFREYLDVRLGGSQRKQRAAITRKQKLLGDLELAFADIFPYKSLDYTVCAYLRLGDLFNDFAQMLYKAPEPPGLTDEELDAFTTLIEDEAIKYENVAVKRYETTVEKSRELKVTSKCARDALAAINKYKPDVYPLFKEEKLRTVFEPYYRVQRRAPEVR